MTRRFLPYRTARGRFCAPALVAVALGACSGEKGVTEGPAGDPVIRLSEGPCANDTCPVYEMTLKADGRYQLVGKRFVRLTGKRFGDLGSEAFTQAARSLDANGFWAAQPDQTARTRANCQTGAPEVSITWRTDAGKQKTLVYDAGCGVEATRRMVADLREALAFGELVWTDQKFNPVAGE